MPQNTPDEHRAWRLHQHGDLRLDTVPSPEPADDGIVVAVEAANVLGYSAALFSGTLGYAFPDFPFTPGPDAIGFVVAAGAAVTHVAAGDRVYLSCHVREASPGKDPAQLLVGVTAMGADPASQALQRRWPNGSYGELAHWPASAATALTGLHSRPSTQLIALAKLLVPYGALKRLPQVGGKTIAVNGATGNFGSAAILGALALGAARVVAVGRNAAALRELAEKLGERVVPAVLSGDPERDPWVVKDAAGGPTDGAIDLLGQATSTASTLSALRSLRRGGRLVLMGSANVPLELSFLEMLANDWEVVGQFMHEAEAPAEVARLISSGALDPSIVDVTAFPLEQLPAAIVAAGGAGGLAQTVLTA